MGKDITPVFRNCLQALRLSMEDKEDAQSSSDRTQKVSVDVDDFREITGKLRESLLNMSHLLRAKQEEYLRIRPTFILGQDSAGNMDTVDEVDSQMETLLILTKENLHLLKSEYLSAVSSRGRRSQQMCQHRLLVVNMLKMTSDRLFDQYKKQVDVRRKRAVLCKHVSSTRLLPTKQDQSSDTQLRHRTSHRRKEDAASTTAINASELEDHAPAPPPVEFTPEELQQFQEENELLYEELSSMSNELRDLETRVEEIDQLQRVFSEHVMQQSEDIDHIADQAVLSTENVRTGNDQLREAMQNKSTMRFWILFMLMLLTGSLVFLDWYND